jgi:hypothetical protein
MTEERLKQYKILDKELESWKGFEYALREENRLVSAAREIADNYIESQKEIIKSFQSSCTQYIESFYLTNLTSIFSPRRVFEVYANALGNYADNLVTATRLGNNMIFANMEVFKT